MGRSPCCEKEHMNKGAWTKEEDERLVSYIKSHGEGCWRSLPRSAGLLRCGKSCRLRWINYLRPDLKRGNFTREEDELIIKLHSLLGNKWSLIAARLPGRTDNEIKNYWNTHIKRKLLSKGIDPATHRSINEQKIPNSKKTEEGQIVKDISFVAHFEKTEKSEDQNQKRNQINGFVCKEEKVIEYYPFVVEQEEEEEICPDLNLDLRISPPWQSKNLVDQGRERETYTACRFYVENGKECSRDTVKCQTEDSSSISYSSSIDISSTNNVAYDFLGLKTRVLDFRSLEIKIDKI